MTMIDLPDETIRQATAGAARAGAPVEDWIGLAVRTLVGLQLEIPQGGRQNPLARPLGKHADPAYAPTMIDLQREVKEAAIRYGQTSGNDLSNLVNLALLSFILKRHEDGAQEDGPFSTEAAVDLLRPYYGKDGKLRVPPEG